MPAESHYRLTSATRKLTNFNVNGSYARMELRLYRDATPLPGEEEIVQSLGRLSERSEGKVLTRIGVSDSTQKPRLLILCHTQGEGDSVCRLLDDLKFTDEVILDREEADKDGSVETNTKQAPHPELDALYSPPRVIH